MSVSYDVASLLKPLVKIGSLRFHKERYEFKCDRSDNQHGMTKKNTPVKSLVWKSSFLSLSHDREMSHDHNHKKRDGF